MTDSEPGTGWTASGECGRRRGAGASAVSSKTITGFFGDTAEAREAVAYRGTIAPVTVQVRSALEADEAVGLLKGTGTVSIGQPEA